MNKQVTPYSNSDKGKKEQVAGMFDTIAPKYDFLNHFLSMNVDKVWRKKVIKIVSAHHPKRILDVATGTGDLAIAALASKPDRIDGIDISEGMLAVGKRKIEEKKLEQKIFLELGDAEAIPFADNTFDAITVAFGVRNFENLQQGLFEMLRVLKPNGICVILEFTMPRKFPFKQFYGFYFKYLLPFIGKIVSKDKSAYTYLPESVKAFPQNQVFITEMANAGFVSGSYKSLTLGIAAIYTGRKS